MSWREHADLASEVIADTMAERDASGELSVRYEPEGGTVRLVRGIFRERPLDLLLQPSTSPVSSWVAKLAVKIAELAPDYPIRPGSRFVLPRPPGGDPLDTSTEYRYEVTDRHPDGEGMVDLVLRRKD